MAEAGALEPLWATCPILPSRIIDLLASNYVKDQTDIVEIESEESDMEAEMEDMVYDEDDE